MYNNCGMIVGGVKITTFVKLSTFFWIPSHLKSDRDVASLSERFLLRVIQAVSYNLEQRVTK